MESKEEKKSHKRIFSSDYDSTRNEWLKKKRKKKNPLCLECIPWYLLTKVGIVKCGVPFARFRHRITKCDFVLHKDLFCIRCLKIAISFYEDGNRPLQKPLNPLSHIVDNCRDAITESSLNENKIEVCGVCGTIGHDYKTHIKTSANPTK